MIESRRRELEQAVRQLKSKETALLNAKIKFADLLIQAVDTEKNSLGDVAKTLASLGRPISRQRVHQVISWRKENINAGN